MLIPGKNSTAIFLILLLAGSVAWIVIKEYRQPRYGYVVITDLYNGFDMKKEMEKKYMSAKSSREKILDSLELELKLISSRIRNENEKNRETIAAFDTKRDEYLERKKTYEEDNNALSKKYDGEILTQLNQYVKNYGEENGYTYIFGSDGNGSLMFAADAQNITKDVCSYINLQYKGE